MGILTAPLMPVKLPLHSQYSHDNTSSGTEFWTVLHRFPEDSEFFGIFLSSFYWECKKKIRNLGFLSVVRPSVCLSRATDGYEQQRIYFAMTCPINSVFTCRPNQFAVVPYCFWIFKSWKTVTIIVQTTYLQYCSSFLLQYSHCKCTE